MNLPLGSGWTAFGRRLIGALRLSDATYREVARQRSALPQAVAVILLSSLASAIVFLIRGSSPGLSVDVDWGSYPITRESNAAAALAGGALDGGWGLLVWALQAAIIWLLWNRFSSRRRAWHEIATPLGFANAPLILFALLELTPVVGGALGIVGLFWTLVTSAFALRAGLQSGWGWAIVLLVISVVILLPLSAGLSLLT